MCHRRQHGGESPASCVTGSEHGGESLTSCGTGGKHAAARVPQRRARCEGRHGGVGINDNKVKGEIVRVNFAVLFFIIVI